MSREAWGDPPEQEPMPEPEPDWMVPQIGPRQQWCCARGCGVCGVKTVPYVWREVRDLNDRLIEQNTTPIDVSSCCGADLMLWDEDKQDTVPFELVERPRTPNVEIQRLPKAVRCNDGLGVWLTEAPHCHKVLRACYLGNAPPACAPRPRPRCSQARW